MFMFCCLFLTADTTVSSVALPPQSRVLRAAPKRSSLLITAEASNHVFLRISQPRWELKNQTGTGTVSVSAVCGPAAGPDPERI